MWLHSSSFLMHSTSFLEVSLARALHAADEMAPALEGTSRPTARHSGMSRAATERSDLDGRRITPSPGYVLVAASDSRSSRPSCLARESTSGRAESKGPLCGMWLCGAWSRKPRRTTQETRQAVVRSARKRERLLDRVVDLEQRQVHRDDDEADDAAHEDDHDRLEDRRERLDGRVDLVLVEVG